MFAQGKAALYTDADSISENVLDPAKSTVADKTGVAPFPAGPKGAHMYSVTSWGLAIAAGSKKKDAAWEFVKWATSKETTIKSQNTGVVPGAKAKFSADWIAAAKASAAGKSYDRPLVVQVGKARDIIGSAIVAAIEGKNVEAAAKEANQQFQALLDTEPK